MGPATALARWVGTSVESDPGLSKPERSLLRQGSLAARFTFRPGFPTFAWHFCWIARLRVLCPSFPPNDSTQRPPRNACRFDQQRVAELMVPVAVGVRDRIHSVERPVVSERPE